MRRVRVRFGSRGPDTTHADLARDMSVPGDEIGRERPWAWEVEGRFPGRGRLARLLARLERVRSGGVDALKLAEWVELGPDDRPPFDEPALLMPALTAAIDQRLIALRALAKSPLAIAITESLMGAARKDERAEVARLVQSLKPLCESKAAKDLVARLEGELLQSAAGGVVAESFSHLLQQHDEEHPLSVA
jgi:hypothetical protein